MIALEASCKIVDNPFTVPLEDLYTVFSMYWVLLSCVSLYSECVERGWWIVYRFQWSERRKLEKGERNWLAKLTVALLVSFIIVKNSLFCQRSSACLAR